MPIGNATWGDFTVNSQAEMIANDKAVIGTTCFRTDIDAPLGKLYTLNSLPASVAANWGPTVGAGTKEFPTARTLTKDDDGLVLECTAAGLAITIPTGLPSGFAIAIIPNGATTVVSSGGTLLNGATSTLTRNSSNNASFGIIGRVSAANSYVVGGA